jgi:hypothetical protein
MEQGTLQFKVIEISGIFPRNFAGCACHAKRMAHSAVSSLVSTSGDGLGFSFCHGVGSTH